MLCLAFYQIHGSHLCHLPLMEMGVGGPQGQAQPTGPARVGPQSCRGSGCTRLEVKAEPREYSVGQTHLAETAAFWARALPPGGKQAADSAAPRAAPEAGQCLMAVLAPETRVSAAVWCSVETALDL